MPDVPVVMLRPEYHEPYGRLLEGSGIDVPPDTAVHWLKLGIAEPASASAVRSAARAMNVWMRGGRPARHPGYVHAAPR
jgi:hypothetical protein